MKLNWAERLAVNNPTRPLQQRLEIQWLKKRTQLGPGAVVLEVGCGRGAGAHIIKTTFEPALLHAMDLDVRMIQKACRHPSLKKSKAIFFYIGDVNSLPYPNATFDAVFGFGLLHHIPDWQGALAEIIRVLKMGGIYFFEELYPSLYQNIITRYVLLHPAGNRFRSRDLKVALNTSGLILGDHIELKKLFILGSATKR
jgi:ubiquinone/menaquinone biosynthesis C-methylase UbiE